MANLPKMTVAVICHNNRSTIRAALESVVNQTYPNIEILLVDDCSDDGTREDLEILRTEYPEIRVLSTLVNSGSAGAPRNLAISATQGEFITFLDGDDLLDRNAIYNFASNVTRYDVDIVSGHMIRRQVANGSESGWHKWMFKEAKTLEIADEFPDLVYDSTSTNKAYRVEFLKVNELQFPEGMYFEDNQFSAKAYAKARGIRVIPDPVYYWLVYPSEQRLTVTANWKNTKSYADRIEAFFAGYHAFGESHQFNIQEKLVEKTIKHDIWLFIDSAFAHSDYSTLVKLWSYAQRVLQTADAEILSRVPLKPRAKVATLLAGDLEAHSEARALVNEPAKLKGSIQNDLWVPSKWTVEQAEQPNVAPYLSVVGDPIGETTISSKEWKHWATDIRTSPSSVTITGSTEDRFERLDKNGRTDVFLRVRRVGANSINTIPGLIKGWSGPTAKWEVTISSLEDQSWLRGTSWSMDLVLAQGDVVVSAPISTRKKVQPITFVPRGQGILSTVRDQISVLTGPANSLILRRRSRESVFGIPGRVLSTLARVKAKTVDQSIGRLNTDQRIRVVGRIARRLPVKKDMVLFESHMGKQYSDSPRAIAEALQQSNPELKQVWSFNSGSFQNSFQGKAVVRHSLEYVVALSRAAAVIDNQGFPSYYRRRSGQLYFQTWHGTPMKAMGLDASNKTRAEIDAIKDSVSNWSVTISPSEYYTQRLIAPMMYDGPVLNIDLPRNDSLYDPSPLTAFDYRQIGVRPNRRYVLWAPTFRERGSKSADKYVNWESLLRGLPDDVIVLFRPHYLNKINIPANIRGRVKDVSLIEEVAKLYRVADLLVTDYSSVIFDFALSDKPIVVFAPDYLDYSQHQRGLNIDIGLEAPGPFITDPAQLGEVITASLKSRPGPEYSAFKKRYTCDGDGNAAAVAAASINDWISNGK